MGSMSKYDQRAEIELRTQIMEQLPGAMVSPVELSQGIEFAGNLIRCCFRVEAKSAEARETTQRLDAERAGIEAELPGQMIATVRKLEATRQGTFLSKAENGTCLSCFVRVRPQMFQEIKQGTAVHTCGNCRRFLYHAASLEPTDGDAGGDSSTASPSSNVEAVNGGAV